MTAGARAGAAKGVFLMPNDLIPGGKWAEPAAGDEPRTGLAPPFRALLGAPAAAAAVNPAGPPEPGHQAVNNPPSQASNADLPTVPGYEVVAELGQGGMGVVYQARQCSLQRLVALKMILAGLHADATARLRFRTEAQAVARLTHPNIVPIYEVGESGGRPFLALEYVDGGSLLRKVAGSAQPEREAARLVETLARAVHYTHRRGILHRDLKPNNVLLTADGTPKITDFGLAKLLDADAGPTRTETLLGTPSYMAPEQAAGDAKKVGAAADVYSLGAILYELLTGRAPFQGATPLNTLEQVRTQEPVPPRRLRRSVSRELETICLKCLEKEPGNRYPSAEALADDLHRFLEGQPVRARPVPVWRRLGRSARRRPALVACALAAAALVGLLLTAGSYFRAAGQLARHRAEEKYRQFVQRRNEALFYGLIAPDEGALFLGGEAAANRKTAESAAREALALAGVGGESGAAAIDPDLPAPRQAEIAADCYALLLVLASLKSQGPGGDSRTPDPGPLTPSPEGKERYQEALRILDRARRLGFQTRAYHLRRAHLLEQLGEQAGARKDRDRAASLPPEGALDQFLAGEERYRRGDWGQAMDSFNRALSLQPGHFWAQFFLAVCHLKGRHWEAAKAGLNACISQQPDFVWAYLFRSFANEKLQAPAEARVDFQKALRLNPSADARYVLFLTRGIFHFNRRELDRAAADFRAALALRPRQYNAYLNLAQVYLARGQFEEAAGQVRNALRFRPPAQAVAGYHLERGRRLLRDGRYEEAVRACDAALGLSPHQPLPHEVRGRALLALGRYRQAERSFGQYLREGGEETSDVFRGRGLARMKLGKYPEAVEDYTRALERAPDGDVYQHRGWAHFFADAWQLALRDFSTAIELDPGAGDAYTGRGLARVMLGHYRQAVPDAEAALRRRPGTPEMMHNVACIFAQAAARAEADPLTLPSPPSDGGEGRVRGADRQSLADSYRRRALQAVHQTLEMLRPEDRPSFWRDKVLPDAALAPIRNEAEFRRLQEEYGQR
jgi:serine/threonine-protein kinase